MGTGGEQGRDEVDRTPFIPINTQEFCHKQNSLLVYSNSVCWTVATKVSGSHVSVLDHDFLSFQLFLPPYVIVHQLLIFAATPSAWFLYFLHRNLPHISSFCTSSRTLWIIFPKHHRTNIIHGLAPSTSCASWSWLPGYGTSAVAQGHMIRKWLLTWGLLPSSQHLGIISNSTFAFVSYRWSLNWQESTCQGLGASAPAWTTCCHILTSLG